MATQKSAETYDVFLSFAYRDREWAERLADELSERGLKAFVANKQPPFNRVKEEQLTTVLEEVRACVVLWSSGSYKDDWVGLELSRSVGRSPVVLVLLEEGPATPRSDYPAIGAIRDEGSYADGPDAVSPATWREVVRAIDRAVRRVPDAVPQPRAWRSRCATTGASSLRLTNHASASGFRSPTSSSTSWTIQ